MLKFFHLTRQKLGLGLSLLSLAFVVQGGEFANAQEFEKFFQGLGHAQTPGDVSGAMAIAKDLNRALTPSEAHALMQYINGNPVPDPHNHGDTLRFVLDGKSGPGGVIQTEGQVVSRLNGDYSPVGPAYRVFPNVPNAKLHPSYGSVGNYNLHSIEIDGPGPDQMASDWGYQGNDKYIKS